MTTAEQISQEIKALPEAVQREVLDFVAYLKAREPRGDDDNWMRFSIRQAMRGLEDEPDIYSPADAKVARP